MRIPVMIVLNAAMLSATPQLRLSSSTIGPLLLVPGTNPAVQTVSASNIGDGSLTLRASSNASWITPSISGTDVQLTLSTASLPKGTATGVVTVTAAGAIDSPQTITVTALVGGGIPDSFNMFLYPGGAVSTAFVASNSMLASAVAPPESTLSVQHSGGESWGLLATTPASTPAESSFSGSIVVAASDFAPDVKTVPVTLNVTAQPIALVAPSLQFNAAQGGAAVGKWIAVRNMGLGTLALNSATVSEGANWLSAQIIGSCINPQVVACVVATGDPTGLAPGNYKGTITLSINAKNGPFIVTVEMDVVPVGPPVSAYQGVVDNAVYFVNQPLAPGELALVRGDLFTLGPATSAHTVPLPTNLGGATVYVNGVAAPVYYVSGSHVTYPNGQITFQVPYGTAAGQATVRVDRNDNGVVQTGNTISMQIANASPRLLEFLLNGIEYAAATFVDGVTYPVPATAGIASRPASAGDVLVFYGIGFGQTVPAASDGQAAAMAPVANALVTFGTSVSTAPSYCGLTPGSVGLYQVNVTVPAGTPKGSAVPVSLTIGGVGSNSVAIAVQ